MRKKHGRQWLGAVVLCWPSQLEASHVSFAAHALAYLTIGFLQLGCSSQSHWRCSYSEAMQIEGNKHFIKLHKYADRFFFGNGLKELRRTHGIYESVIMRFVAWDKNTTFNVDVVGPLHRQTHQRSAATTRRYVFTIDVFEDMIQHNYQLAGDEVVFYYSFDQYLWEVLYRKQVKWDEEEDIIDST
ncbi:hypothetical protein JHK87_039310 [Glycine soja]|nr:hypothetical protein JHK87_039310 [Glycine soja]